MERVRACRQTFGTALPPTCPVIADHLSARSLSVTWIHWYVINFASKKGFGRQHTAFTSCKILLFLWRVDYALEGLVLNDSCRLFHTDRSWTAYWFSAVMVSGRRDCPLMQEYSLRLKKLLSQAQEDAMLKMFTSDYLNQIVCYVPTKNRSKSNLSTVSVLANRSLHQDLMHSGCRGTTVPNVFLQALTLSLPSPRDFVTLSPNNSIKCFTFFSVYMNPHPRFCYHSLLVVFRISDLYFICSRVC